MLWTFHTMKSDHIHSPLAFSPRCVSSSLSPPPHLTLRFLVMFLNLLSWFVLFTVECIAYKGFTGPKKTDSQQRNASSSSSASSGILSDWTYPGLMHAVTTAMSSYAYCMWKAVFLKVMYHFWLLYFFCALFLEDPWVLERKVWDGPFRAEYTRHSLLLCASWAAAIYCKQPLWFEPKGCLSMHTAVLSKVILRLCPFNRTTVFGSRAYGLSSYRFLAPLSVPSMGYISEQALDLIRKWLKG